MRLDTMTTKYTTVDEELRTTKRILETSEAMSVNAESQVAGLLEESEAARAALQVHMHSASNKQLPL